MHAKITIDKQRSFDFDALAQMYRLRAKVFGERMGWEVAVLSGMEIDDYDEQSPYYMLVRDESGAVCGCWRLLPTEGRYMLRDTFPQLLHGQDAPASASVWELSRFAIVSPQRAGYGFGELALDAMRAVVRFADRMGVTSYVTVTTTAVERLLSRARIDIRRFGPPVRIGSVHAVALTIDLGAQTHEALFDGMGLSRPGLPRSAPGGIAHERLEQPLRTTDECATRLVEPQECMHFAREPNALGRCDTGEGRIAAV
jgi:acyl homoserine lactone synthase